MSIKCSLLGHDFGETAVEREREEDGSEVIITITELETCTRCGETRVVSENKEVTTMEAPDDVADADADAGTAATAGGADEGDDLAEYDPEDDDAEILGDDASETDAQAQARGATIPDAESDAPDADAGASADADPEVPEDDDAVILGDDAGAAGADEGADAADADPGEWPEEAGETTDAESGADEGVDAGDAGVVEDADVGAETAAEGADATAATDADPGEWPEETRAPSDVADDPMDDWPEETKRDEPGDAAAAGPPLEESASPTVTVPEGMFKCGECGFTTEVESSSLRAGDFCPECHKGTLVQRADSEE